MDVLVHVLVRKRIAQRFDIDGVAANGNEVKVHWPRRCYDERVCREAALRERCQHHEESNGIRLYR